MADFNATTRRRDAVLIKRLGGVIASITRANALNLSGVTVRIDKDVDVAADNGMSVMKRTVITFRADQLVESGKRVLLDEGDEVEAGGECFQLLHVVSDDGSVVTWYAR